MNGKRKANKPLVTFLSCAIKALINALDQSTTSVPLPMTVMKSAQTNAKAV